MFNRGRAVAIVGGGIGGLTAALAFARTGAMVTVLERAAALRELGAGLQVTPNGMVVLQALGLNLSQGIRAEAVEPMDGLSGQRIARFDLTGLKGAPYRFFHRADLIGALAEQVRMAGVQVRTDTPVRAVGGDGAITLSSGAVLHPDLAVGADGLHSVTRAALNGPDAPFFTGQTAWRSVVVADAPPVARLWMAPGRHVVTYPLPGGRLNIVAVREQADWTAEGWNLPGSPDDLRAAFADLCPDLRAILDKVTETRLWGLFRHPVARHWHGAATAILGDAAHPTLPFLAQGANLAIEDAWVLAACCDRAPALQGGLAAYQHLRRPRVERAINAANANAVNYHLGGWQRTAAHAGLRVLGRVAPTAFLRRMDWLYGHDVTAG